MLAVVSAEALLSDFPAKALSQTSFYLKDAAGQVLGRPARSGQAGADHAQLGHAPGERRL